MAGDMLCIGSVPIEPEIVIRHSLLVYKGRVPPSRPLLRHVIPTLDFTPALSLRVALVPGQTKLPRPEAPSQNLPGILRFFNQPFRLSLMKGEFNANTSAGRT